MSAVLLPKHGRGSPVYEDRKGFKGSVVLREFNEQRAKQREAEQRAQPAAQTGKRLYAGAQHGRLTSDWNVLNTSADSEIITAMRPIRARARALVRDNDYANNAVRIIKNNVIGTGIRMQAAVSTAGGKLNDRINTIIEDGFEEWSLKENCHTAGLLNLAELEATITGMLATDGEVLIRKIRQPMGKLRTPLTLEVIEADRLVDQWSSAYAPNGNRIRMGVEVNQWGRPVAYWFYPNHPGDFQLASFNATQFIRVPADEIIHLYVIDRWPQTRGISWFHTSIMRLHDAGGYEEAEIVKARATASVVGFITTDGQVIPDATESNGDQLRNFEPGTIERLMPGETFTGFNPSAPNPNMDPFMRYMIRSVAAGVGMSYESLSRDYSQSNYSSSRLALLDDRDLWRVLQGFVIRNFRADIHKEWLQAAVLAGDVNIPDFFSNQKKYQKVRFKPRGWSWIDPAKEVAAYKMAVRSGFMTVGDVISKTADGEDFEDIMKRHHSELETMKEMGLVFDTNPAVVNDKGQSQQAGSGSDAEGTAADDKPAGNGNSDNQQTDD